MGVAWKDIHIGTYKSFLYLARFKKNEDGEEVVQSKSANITEELVRALMKTMRYKLEHSDNPDDKAYIGYQDKEGGTLVYILPGWTFSVRRQGKREK